MEFVGDKVTLEVFLLLAFPAYCRSTSVSSVASTNGIAAFMLADALFQTGTLPLWKQ